MNSDSPTLPRMQALIQQWHLGADQRAVFLSCYVMMTSNMLDSLQQDEFYDPAWVERLLDRFAEYYFNALEAYDASPASAPPVWQLAHTASLNPHITALQLLLLGVNAHINYDLVLALTDLLDPEWGDLSDELREIRHADHTQVNAVIGRTIDAVQDQVLEPSMPVMDVIDKLFGSLDEIMLSRLISDWRENTWLHATRLLAAADPQQRQDIIHEVEESALKLGRLIE